MKTDAQLLQTLTGGGIYKGQPITSVLTPATVIGGRARRTPTQAKKLMAVGSLLEILQRIKSRGRRKNPPVAEMDVVGLIKMLTGAKVTPAEAEDLLRQSVTSSAREMKVMYGITSTQSKKLEALGEVYKRLTSKRRYARPQLKRPEEVYDFMAPLLAHEEIEYFMCLPLDARSRLIGKPRKTSQGDVDGTDAGPRAFFRTAVRVGAVATIALHNHPTGDPEPSPADRAVTRRLVAAGKGLDIPLVDHIIVGANGFYSIRMDDPTLFQ